MSGETSAPQPTTRRLPDSREFMDSSRGSFRTHLTNLYGENVFHDTKTFTNLRDKRARLLCQLAFLLRCRDEDVLPEFVTLKHHIRSPAASRILRRAGSALLRERVHQTRTDLAKTEFTLYQLHLRLAFLLSCEDWNTLDFVSSKRAAQQHEETRTRQSRKFDTLARKQHPIQRAATLSKAVVNLSGEELDNTTVAVLAKGLNFATAPKQIPIADIVAGVESALVGLPEEQAEDIRQNTARIVKHARAPRTNLAKEERLALLTLRSRRDLVIVPADKGNATVVMKAADYHDKVAAILADDSTYSLLEHNPVHKIRTETAARIRNSHCIEASKKLALCRNNSSTPRFYGLPKVHKPDVPLRPIVSAINSPTHALARLVADHLAPLAEGMHYAVRNSTHFVDIIRQQRLNEGDMLVSFDVTSLFTKVPVHEAVEVIRQKLQIRSQPTEWAELAEFCLSSTFFQYQDRHYAQVEGAAMGSPLSPIAANLFMEAFESEALRNALHKPSLWVRYVDDTFVIWPHGPELLEEFLLFLNSIHQSIQFTMETEINNCLPFLDVLVSKREDGTLGHAVYRKPTHTDRYLHADSHHHPAIKLGVLKTLATRAVKVCDERSLPAELQKLEHTFRANSYSQTAIKRVLASVTGHSGGPRRTDGRGGPEGRGNAEDCHASSEVEESARSRLAVIPYVRCVTDRVGKLLRKNNIRTVFTAPDKLHNALVRIKDALPPLQSAGVYEVPCSCGRTYIGETGRSVAERLKEHIAHYNKNNTNRSAIAHHSEVTGHAIDFDKTRLLHKENRYWPRRIKEALEIHRRPQNINADAGLALNHAWKSLAPFIRDRQGTVHHRPTTGTSGARPTVHHRPTTGTSGARPRLAQTTGLTVSRPLRQSQRTCPSREPRQESINHRARSAAVSLP